MKKKTRSEQRGQYFFEIILIKAPSEQDNKILSDKYIHIFL